MLAGISTDFCRKYIILMNYPGIMDKSMCLTTIYKQCIIFCVNSPLDYINLEGKFFFEALFFYRNYYCISYDFYRLQRSG